MAEALFLQVFQGTNKQVPVWFMRQAGRYLPQYQVLKKKHSLQKMFDTPELAAEVTCLPVDILGVDAAILFADILTLPAQMGLDIRFDDEQGPVIEKTVGLDPRRQGVHDAQDFSRLTETIRLVKERLPGHIPLIGFAGSPFTVLTYLIEGGSSVHFARTFRFAHEQPQPFQAWLELLTHNTIRYLNAQKEAGIQAFQLFDSWAGILRPADFARWALPCVRRIFREVDLPSIYFTRNSASLLALMDQSGADVLSVDHSVVLGHHTIIEKTKKGIQGNLFNGLLYADDATLGREVRDVLVGGCRHPRYIFNLSHGVFPDTKVDKLKLVVEQVHGFQLEK